MSNAYDINEGTQRVLPAYDRFAVLAASVICNYFNTPLLWLWSWLLIFLVCLQCKSFSQLPSIGMSKVLDFHSFSLVHSSSSPIRLKNVSVSPTQHVHWLVSHFFKSMLMLSWESFLPWKLIHSMFVMHWFNVFISLFNIPCVLNLSSSLFRHGEAEYLDSNKTQYYISQLCSRQNQELNIRLHIPVNIVDSV